MDVYCFELGFEPCNHMWSTNTWQNIILYVVHISILYCLTACLPI